jgi:uncharacterized protein (UPF0264 family)
MKTLFLASVTSVAEAELAVSGGADIIDCKDPARGALGALPVETVAAIKKNVPQQQAVSATIGDLVCDPAIVAEAAVAMAASGCDIIKIGFFPGGDASATIRAVGESCRQPTRIVGLLLADLEPDFSLISEMSEAGFAGVMVDTAHKSNGTLRRHLPDAVLAKFVEEARKHGLFAGFAGSLGLTDIATLMRLKPNILGFRGALCAGAVRTDRLSLEAVRAVRAELDRRLKRGLEPLVPDAHSGYAK